ncbi:MAG TPA: NAD-dependent epimerase/dehydratase family protein [Anaeromyxobacteraceae bacterium]|nr:NAD-dependent epimerase/dehydratase family protein [Anaeromyxobacteraceae bacterium]
MSSGQELHVVFGAGQIGPLLADVLARQGKAVRVVRRSSASGVPGVEVVRGDALDRATCVAVTRGASVIYDCMNPAYSAKLWARQLPLIADNLIAAAGTNAARLVVLDNLYMLGRPGGKPLDEKSPLAPVSRKGEIRAEAAERFTRAHRHGDARVLMARASDFYGPGAVGSQFEAHFWNRLLAGKSIQLLMNPDTPHTYHHVGDVARGLAVLGAAPDDAFGGVWMLPCAPAVTTRALAEKLVAAAGHPGARIQRMPRLAVKALSLVWPLMREVDEMLYQWEEPFVVDDSRFRARFGASVTPLDEGARQMAEWATRWYGQRRAELKPKTA